ncbi:MAG TPA: hypothetical protein VG269_29490 [Tepidisphaeraceae bacterium]|nr:hypothetical protein [Tepidisphaeraceae bacterium]
MIQALEARTLLSSQIANVDLSQMLGNQAGGAVAADPILNSSTGSTNLAAVSNSDFGEGILVATSSNGGISWSSRVIGNDKDGLPPAYAHSSVAFDSFGNLFVAYFDRADRRVVVLFSADAGTMFSMIGYLGGQVAQPKLATGPGNVWLAFNDGNSIAVSHASDTGNNEVGIFNQPMVVPRSAGGMFPTIAVSPGGDPMVAFQREKGNGTARIVETVDKHGVFSPLLTVTTTHISPYEKIPADPASGINPDFSIAYDQGSDSFSGDAYIVYADSATVGSDNTDVYVRFLISGYSAWSDPIRLNDDSSSSSHFLPAIAVDAASGNVAVSWYDSGNDLGTGGSGDTDGIPNDDVEYYATVFSPLYDGITASTSHEISIGATNASDAGNAVGLGDTTGLAYLDGTLYPEWFDNSNSTANNPNGALRGLNIYGAAVPDTSFTLSKPEIVAAPPPPIPLPAAGRPSPLNGWANPNDVIRAYGIDSIKFGNVTGTGAGETIAIVDAYDDPSALADLEQFDGTFNLPNPPSFKKVNEDGRNALPPAPPARGLHHGAFEESIDVQWAHAIAPSASIILIETNSGSYDDEIAHGVATAEHLPAVMAISLSFAGSIAPSVLRYDNLFTTPKGHGGITFVAATGDSGAAAGPQYPASVPNVLAVGGTDLDPSNEATESVWSDSGSGVTNLELQPKYQKGIVSFGTTGRATPDVSIDSGGTDANVGEPLTICDSYDGGRKTPWFSAVGTSISAPMWAGLIAIADQGRSLAGLSPLDGPSQTLPALYSAPDSDYHKIGSTESSTISAYDPGTGLGSPVANKLIPDMAFNDGTFVVTTAKDGGSGSLRQAIEEANLYGAVASISFNIRAVRGTHRPPTIRPTTPLPKLINTNVSLINRVTVKILGEAGDQV